MWKCLINFLVSSIAAIYKQNIYTFLGTLAICLRRMKLCMCLSYRAVGGQSHGRERQDMAYGSVILRVTFSWHVYFPLRFFCSPPLPRHPTFTYPDPPLKLCISGPWLPVPSQTIRLSLCVTVSSLKEGAAFALQDDHHCHQCRYYDHHIHRGPKIQPFRRLHYQQQQPP